MAKIGAWVKQKFWRRSTSSKWIPSAEAVQREHIASPLIHTSCAGKVCKDITVQSTCQTCSNLETFGGQEGGGGGGLFIKRYLWA